MGSQLVGRLLEVGVQSAAFQIPDQGREEGVPGRVHGRQ